MPKKIIYDKKELMYRIEAELEAIKDLERMLHHNNDLFDMEKASFTFGESFMRHIYDLCDKILNLVSLDYVDENGTLPIPSLKDLGNKKKDYSGVFSHKTIASAKGLIGIIKELGSNGPDAGLVFAALDFARMFLDEANFMSREDPLINECYRRIEMMSEMCKDWRNGHREDLLSRSRYHEIERRSDDPMSPMLQTLICRYDEDEEGMTEEESDEFHRPHSKNSAKHLAIVEILELFRKIPTDRDHRLGVQQVQQLLEERCSIYLERKAVGRDLIQLQEADFLCKFGNADGYWYDPELAENRRPDYE